MSRKEKINFVSIDFSTCPEKCELCGAKSELRPYGPFRQWICVDCGMKNKSMTEKRMGEAMDGRGKVKHSESAYVPGQPFWRED